MSGENQEQQSTPEMLWAQLSPDTQELAEIFGRGSFTRTAVNAVSENAEGAEKFMSELEQRNLIEEKTSLELYKEDAAKITPERRAQLGKRYMVALDITPAEIKAIQAAEKVEEYEKDPENNKRLVQETRLRYTPAFADFLFPLDAEKKEPPLATKPEKPKEESPPWQPENPLAQLTDLIEKISVEDPEQKRLLHSAALELQRGYAGWKSQLDTFKILNREPKSTQDFVSGWDTEVNGRRAFRLYNKVTLLNNNNYLDANGYNLYVNTQVKENIPLADETLVKTLQALGIAEPGMTLPQIYADLQQKGFIPKHEIFFYHGEILSEIPTSVPDVFATIVLPDEYGKRGVSLEFEPAAVTKALDLI